MKSFHWRNSARPRLEGQWKRTGGACFLGEVKQALAHYERVVALARETGNQPEASALKYRKDS
jgi:hypothetical protein